MTMRVVEAIAWIAGALVGLAGRAIDWLSGRRKTWDEEIDP